MEIANAFMHASYACACRAEEEMARAAKCTLKHAKKHVTRLIRRKKADV